MVQRTGKGLCDICPAGCGVEITIEDDLLTDETNRATISGFPAPKALLCEVETS